jgi:hypothetical protein
VAQVVGFISRYAIGVPKGFDLIPKNSGRYLFNNPIGKPDA